MAARGLHKLPRAKRRQAPAGFEGRVEAELAGFDERMREAVAASHEGKRRNEGTWEVTRIHWERNRFVFEEFYRRKAISRELFDWLCQCKLADRNLIAKWRKPGYEQLCSLQAIQTRDTNFGTVSQCRVPLKKRNPQQWGPSVRTGCVSCVSGDKGAPIWWFHSGWREHFEGERERYLAKKAGKGPGKRGAGEDEDEEDPEVAERIKRLKALG